MVAVVAVADTVAMVVDEAVVVVGIVDTKAAEQDHKLLASSQLEQPAAGKPPMVR